MICGKIRQTNYIVAFLKVKGIEKMELYFNLKGTEFDTNIPEEMQIWLRDALYMIGEKTLTNEIVDLLKLALKKVNDNKVQDLFIAYRHNAVNAGKDGAYCSSPFDAATNAINGTFIVIDDCSDETIGEYYRENFSELYDEYLELIEEDEYVDPDDMMEFGSWIIDFSGREIYQVEEEDKSYDFTDYKYFNSLAKIKDEFAN